MFYQDKRALYLALAITFWTVGIVLSFSGLIYSRKEWDIVDFRIAGPVYLAYALFMTWKFYTLEKLGAEPAIHYVSGRKPRISVQGRDHIFRRKSRITPWINASQSFDETETALYVVDEERENRLKRPRLSVAAMHPFMRKLSRADNRPIYTLQKSYENDEELTEIQMYIRDKKAKKELKNVPEKRKPSIFQKLSQLELSLLSAYQNKDGRPRDEEDKYGPSLMPSDEDKSKRRLSMANIQTIFRRKSRADLHSTITINTPSEEQLEVYRKRTQSRSDIDPDFSDSEDQNAPEGLSVQTIFRRKSRVDLHANLNPADEGAPGRRLSLANVLRRKSKGDIEDEAVDIGTPAVYRKRSSTELRVEDANLAFDNDGAELASESGWDTGKRRVSMASIFGRRKSHVELAVPENDNEEESEDKPQTIYTRRKSRVELEAIDNLKKELKDYDTQGLDHYVRNDDDDMRRLSVSQLSRRESEYEVHPAITLNVEDYQPSTSFSGSKQKSRDEEEDNSRLERKPKTKRLSVANLQTMFRRKSSVGLDSSYALNPEEQRQIFRQQMPSASDELDEKEFELLKEEENKRFQRRASTNTFQRKSVISLEGFGAENLRTGEIDSRRRSSCLQVPEQMYPGIAQRMDSEDEYEQYPPISMEYLPRKKKKSVFRKLSSIFDERIEPDEPEDEEFEREIPQETKTKQKKERKFTILQIPSLFHERSHSIEEREEDENKENPPPKIVIGGKDDDVINNVEGDIQNKDGRVKGDKEVTDKNKDGRVKGDKEVTDQNKDGRVEGDKEVTDQNKDGRPKTERKKRISVSNINTLFRRKSRMELDRVVNLEPNEDTVYQIKLARKDSTASKRGRDVMMKKRRKMSDVFRGRAKDEESRKKSVTTRGSVLRKQENFDEVEEEGDDRKYGGESSGYQDGRQRSDENLDKVDEDGGDKKDGGESSGYQDGNRKSDEKYSTEDQDEMRKDPSRKLSRSSKHPIFKKKSRVEMSPGFTVHKTNKDGGNKSEKKHSILLNHPLFKKKGDPQGGKGDKDNENL